MSSGELAVDGFFLVSGYLIAISWMTSRSAGDFIIKRILRIYPGYLVAFAISAVLGMISAAPQSTEYVKMLVRKNESVLQTTLFLASGPLDQKIAFPTNPVPYLVNGSLWTIQPEFQCYGIILVLGLFGMLCRGRILIGLAILAYGMYAVRLILVPHSSSNEFSMWRLLTFFLLGATVARYGLRCALAGPFPCYAQPGCARRRHAGLSGHDAGHPLGRRLPDLEPCIRLVDALRQEVQPR